MKKAGDSSNKLVLLMLILVVVLSVFSLAVYFVGNNVKTTSSNDYTNEEITPQFEVRGTASLTIEKPKEK